MKKIGEVMGGPVQNFDVFERDNGAQDLCADGSVSVGYSASVARLELYTKIGAVRTQEGLEIEQRLR